MSVAHKDLSGAELHEPKGISSASVGTVYIADGAGSGAWHPFTDYVLNINEYSLTESMTDISAANGRVYFRVPVKSELVELSVVLDGILATASDILNIYINGVLFADSLTVPYATSGAGVTSAFTIVTPNTLTPGTVVEVRSNGNSDNVVRAFVQLRLRAKA